MIATKLMSTSPVAIKYTAIEVFTSKKERTKRRWSLHNHHKYDIRNLNDKPGLNPGEYVLEYEIWNHRSLS